MASPCELDQLPARADIRKWREAVKALPADARAKLADLFQPGELKRLREVERMECQLALFVGRSGHHTEIARQIFADLRLYAASSWLVDKHGDAPTNPRHQAMFDYLRSSDGEVPSLRTLRRRAAELAI